MYATEEYKKRVEELDPIAKDLIMNKRPDDARKMASEMSPEDAYMLGEHIGGLLEIGYHMHGNDIRGALVKAMEKEEKKRERKRDRKKIPLS